MEKNIWQHAFQYTLAAILALGCFGITYLLVHKEIPPDNRDALLILLGVIATSFTQVIQYYFGSSKGSADKNKIISGGQE